MKKQFLGFTCQTNETIRIIRLRRAKPKQFVEVTSFAAATAPTVNTREILRNT
jgi:hypothetical protein